MAVPTFESVQVGDALPDLLLPQVNRTTLTLFAGASGDHNPIHIDLDFARRAGLPDVIAHGMLGMAWLGRLLTSWCGQSRLRRFDARFIGIIQVGHIITCRGEVIEKLAQEGERRVRVRVRATNQYGEDKILGEGLLALP